MKFVHTRNLSGFVVLFFLCKSTRNFTQSVQVNPAAMSLCFADAFRAKQAGKITQEEYFSHLLAHFRGVRHPQDHGRDLMVQTFDAVGASIRKMALSDGYQTMHGMNTAALKEMSWLTNVADTTIYEKLLHGCLKGDIEQVKTKLKELEDQTSYPVPLQPLATLAAQNGHVEILQFCINKGAVFDWYLDKAAEAGAQIPAMLEALWELNWRDIQHSQKALDKLVTVSVRNNNVKMLLWLFSHGGQVNSSTVAAASLPTKNDVAIMSILLEKCGLAPFKKRGALQGAAQYGNPEKVKLLLDAGADIEELPTEADEREPFMYGTALYEAVEGQHVDVIRLLLEHGAKVDTPCKQDGVTPLQVAKRLGNREILDLLEQR